MVLLFWIDILVPVGDEIIANILVEVDLQQYFLQLNLTVERDEVIANVLSFVDVFDTNIVG